MLTGTTLKVHLIWITKYRYEVLTKEVGESKRCRPSRKLQDEFPQLGKEY